MKYVFGGKRFAINGVHFFHRNTQNDIRNYNESEEE